MRILLVFVLLLICASAALAIDFVYGKDAFRTDETSSVYDNYVDKDGKPITGNVVRFYDSGRMRSSAQVVDGFAEGEMLSYYENSGKSKRVSPYKKGQLQGVQKAYFESGKLEAEIEWENGEPHGLFKAYRTNGSLLIQLSYDNGTAMSGDCVNKEGQLIPLTPAQVYNLNLNHEENPCQ